VTANELPLAVILPATLLLIVGGLLTVIGSLGLLRLEPFFARMHGPSMGNTLGMGSVLIVSMLISSTLAHRPIAHEIVIIAFVAMTSPMTAMLLMRTSVLRSKARAP